jgi:hypothetical protein
MSRPSGGGSSGPITSGNRLLRDIADRDALDSAAESAALGAWWALTTSEPTPGLIAEAVRRGLVEADRSPNPLAVDPGHGR